MICKTSMFLFNFLIVLSLPWTCLGHKKARISLQLVESLCGQYAVFETTNLLQPPLKKSSSSLHGEVRWQICGVPNQCEPFSFIVNAGGKKYQRVKTEFAQNLYPNLCGFVLHANHHKPRVLSGHGIFVNSRLAITSATSIGEEVHQTYFVKHYYPVVNSLKRHNNWFNQTQTICSIFVHPKFNRVTKSHNFAIVIFTHNIIPPEKFRNVSFAKQGQTFKGPCKYQSWGKLNLLNRIYSYADDLMEAEVEILPSHECLTAGFPSTHICTPPVLCGLHDSGAPLVCSENNVDYVVGLSSHYNMNYDDPSVCGGNVLSSFTTITAMDWDWVNDTLEKYFESCKDLPPWNTVNTGPG